MIWAQARGGVIGRDNTLPWHLPEDLAHFKATTAGHPVIMGRKQWQSLPERFRPLPRRRNIVLTRAAGYRAPGAEVVSSLPQALDLVAGLEAWICGGGEIYAQAMPHAQVLVVTEIDLDPGGDVFAPAIGPEWVLCEDGGWRTSSNGTAFRIRRYHHRAGHRGDSARGGIDGT